MLEHDFRRIFMHFFIDEGCVVARWDRGRWNPYIRLITALRRWEHFLWRVLVVVAEDGALEITTALFKRWDAFIAARAEVGVLIWFLRDFGKTDIRLRSLVNVAVVIYQIRAFIADTSRCHHFRKVRSPLVVRAGTWVFVVFIHWQDRIPVFNGVEWNIFLRKENLHHFLVHNTINIIRTWSNLCIALFLSFSCSG